MPARAARRADLLEDDGQRAVADVEQRARLRVGVGVSDRHGQRLQVARRKLQSGRYKIVVKHAMGATSVQ